MKAYTEVTFDYGYVKEHAATVRLVIEQYTVVHIKNAILEV